MLRPGPGLPREMVDASQRDRLFAAMVAAVAKRGYEATRVADLLKLSGVSRSDFYRHFSNKQECFLAACDAIVEDAMLAVSSAYRSDGAWDRRLLAAFEAFVDFVVSQPAASRMCVVDIYAAGPEAIERADAAAGQFERLVRQSLDESPTRANMPSAIVRGIVGGVRKVVYTRLQRREEGELRALVPALGGWALRYRTPAEPIQRAPSQFPAPTATGFAEHGQLDRIYSSVADAAASKGYTGLTVADIVAGASTSLSRFYSHFPNKEDAFLAAYDAGIGQLFAAALGAYQRAPDWPHAVRGACDAVLAYFAAEPAWADLTVRQVLAVGPRAIERRDNGLKLFESMLEPGYEHAPRLPKVASEAITGAIYTLLYQEIRRRGTDRLQELLPSVATIALAPFIGSEAAASIANEPATF